MQAVRNKIRSRRGASLTFALLLFLVCAVVGSVVLTAGTAASGRMSQIAEMDQRYYSVNSAARLLIDTIDGEEVTIVETKMDGVSPTYKKSGSEKKIDGFASVAEEAAYFYIKEIAGAQSQASSRIKSLSADSRMGIDLTASGNTVLSLNVKEEMRDNGDLILTVAQGSGDNTYAMELTFTMDARPIKSIQADRTVTTWKIAWHIRNVEVLGSNRWKK